MKKFSLILPALLFPVLVSAQVRTVADVGSLVIGIINEILVPAIFAIAFIVFIWGVFQYFIGGKQDEETRQKGKQLMIWGLIGFFVMVSVWGLVNILVNTAGLDTNLPEYPKSI